MYSVDSNNIVHSKYGERIVAYCNRKGINSHNFRCYSQCIYRSKIYKKGYCISQYLDNACCENTVILRIIEIVSFCGCDSLYLACHRIKVEKYHMHFAAYAIDVFDESSREECVLMPIEKFSGPPVNVHKTSRGLNMIRPKQYC